MHGTPRWARTLGLLLGAASVPLGLVGLLVLATDRGTPAAGQAPLSPGGRTWHVIPMTNGPAVWWACVEGARVFALQDLHSRGKEGLWPGASVAAVWVPGGCRE